jgi:glutathione S-transferase
MLELYHWEPNAACARVLITLKEKGLEFTSRYVDVLAFEQHTPAFLQLNETGETPVLVRDGEAYFESSYICEYLDEAFPEVPLMPADPLGRWEARVWQKFVDDYIAACVSDLAWDAYGRMALEGRNLDFDKAVGTIKSTERRDLWTSALAGFDAETMDRSRGRLKDLIGKMEADLARSGWLAGDSYSLADIAVFAYVNYLPRLMTDALNATAAPRVSAWLATVGARPAVMAALAMARVRDPYMTAAPGPEHVRWG